MKISKLLSFAVLFLFAISNVGANELQNTGFEEGYTAWTVSEAQDKAVSLSDDAYSGQKSIKITQTSGVVEQQVSVETNSYYHLTSYIKGAGLVGVKVGPKIYFDRQPKSKKWHKFTVRFNTGETEFIKIFMAHNGSEGRFDDFSLSKKGPTSSQKVSPNVIAKSSGGSGLSSDLAPGENFDLLGWYLSIPTDKDKNGKSDSIYEIELAKGYQNSDFFYTGADGGMVFRTPLYGYKTSKNTNYTRTELREMLRRGDKKIKTKEDDGTPNKNNWVFSSTSERAQQKAGAVDGKLEATLAINHVSTTGRRSQVGRVIIGQIHAKDDEPIRLYYRKLPENNNGVIYAAHESCQSDSDIYYDIIGSRANDAENPVDGFGLNEKFSYIIDAKGYFLYVTIKQGESVVAETTIDMTTSCYDIDKEYMYFKAGVYNQNNTGSTDDYVQATFYRLKASH